MGFAGEIKDFLGAATSTYKLMGDQEYKGAMTKYTQTQEEKMRKEMEDPLNEEMKKAQIADIKSRTANRGAGIALQNRLLDQAEKQRLAAEGAAASGITGPTSRPAQRPAVGADTEDDDKPVVQGFRRGGIVQKFQDGGYAEDDDDEEVTSPGIGAGYETATMPPAVGGTSDATEFSSQSRTKTPIPIARSTALQAITDAQKYGISMMGGNGAVPGASRQRGLRAYAMGAGAAPSNEMLNIYRKIDPNGEMGESERNMTAIGALYDYKMKAGDPQGAARVAFQALQSYKTAARNYAAIGAAAMQGGKIDDGLKAIMKSYANIPDGQDMKLWRSKDGQINYEVTGADGKKVSAGIAPPDQILGAAMKVAGGAGFDEHLMDMASGGMPGGRGAVGGGGRKKKAEEPGTGASEADKPQNYRELEGQVYGDVDKWVEGLKGGTSEEKAAAAGLKPRDLAMIKNGVFHIRANSGMTTDESIRTFNDFVGAPATYNKKEGPAFSVQKDQANSEVTLRMRDGRVVTMPSSDYASLAAARGQRIKELEDKAKEPPKETYSEQFGRASEAAGKMFSQPTDPRDPSGMPRVGDLAPSQAPSPYGARPQAGYAVPSYRPPVRPGATPMPAVQPLTDERGQPLQQPPVQPLE